MPTLTSCSEADADLVQAAFLSAINTASAALSHYTLLASDPTIPAADQANYKAQLETAANDLKLIKAKQIAFMTDSPLGDVTPPSALTVADLQNIEQQVAQLDVDNNNGAEILQLVSQAFSVIAQM